MPTWQPSAYRTFLSPIAPAVRFSRRTALGRIIALAGTDMLALTGVQSVAANRRRTIRPWAAEVGEAGTDGTDAVTIPVDNFGADNADGTGGSEHARGGDDGVGAPDESTVTGARARNDRRG